MGRGANTALVIWSFSALSFGLLMGLVVRTLFGTKFFKGLGIVCVAAIAFAIQAKLFSVVSPSCLSAAVVGDTQDFAIGREWRDVNHRHS